MKSIIAGLVLLVLIAGGCTTSAPVALQPVSGQAVFQGDYVEVLQTSKPPVLIRPVTPRFPPALRGVEGFVTLAYIVGKDGIPQQIQTLEADDVAFARAAEAAVRQWHFKPGEIDGKTVAVAIEQIISFNLN